MDDRLLQYYERELRHLREMGGEFSREFPKIAGRLGMDGIDCADPYVERLLEGFAFLAARVQLKIDAEYPRFTQHLLETLYPQYLSPLPSMAIAQFAPNLSEGSLAAGVRIPRGSLLRGMLGASRQTRCTYTTASDVVLWPLEVADFAYHTRDLGSLGLGSTLGAKAALRLRLRATAGLPINEIAIDELVVQIRNSGSLSMRVYESLHVGTLDVVAHDPGRPPAWTCSIGRDALGQVGFRDDEALLPVSARVFQGQRLLQEYFALPERFMSFRLGGLRKPFAACSGSTIDLTILLKHADVELEDAVTAEMALLFCTPIVNLFERKLDRIQVTDRSTEFHLVPDRTAPLDFEVHSVVRAGVYTEENPALELPFRSFYKTTDLDEGLGYYVINRVPRTLSERERLGRRRSVRYVGTDVFISLVDANAAPYRGGLRQLAVTALCTNRDLPIQMPIGQGDTDFVLDQGGPIRSIRCVGSPSAPMPSHVEGEFAWRLVSHLTPNYLAIAGERGGGDAAQALQETLRLFSNFSRPEVRKQVEGVRGLRCRPIERRVGSFGPVAFARGMEMRLEVDESAFEGSGVFLLGAVLEHYFARYITMNSFTETVLQSAQRGEIHRWPARIGTEYPI